MPNRNFVERYDNMTYMIYQRTLSDEQVKRINAQQDSDFAMAYFALLFPSHENANQRALDAIELNMYKQTMLISCTDGMSLTLSDIFDAGNGYAREGINVVSLQKHPSMSVGDIAVDLLENVAVMCMPAGWKELDIKLTLA